MSLIRLNNLNKHYMNGSDRIAALQDLNVQVEEGCFLGVMGPSGSGKSTLLSILGGLCHPTSGTLEIDGINVYTLSQERLADFRREYLGFVFQSHNLVPYLTALENVMLPLAVTRFSTAEKKQMAEAMLERVGLSGRVRHLPQELSGGEQERVAIARALVNRPPLLLADEPTGSLDTTTSQQILELLSELHRDGQTIVMVTHNPENRKWFDRLIVLRDGRIVESTEADRKDFPAAV